MVPAHSLTAGKGPAMLWGNVTESGALLWGVRDRRVKRFVHKSESKVTQSYQLFNFMFIVQLPSYLIAGNLKVVGPDAKEARGRKRC